MSWYVHIAGKPAAVCEELGGYADAAGLVGQSRLEFEAARPHLQALVAENFSKEVGPPFIQLEASGSGYVRNGEQVSRSCTVSIKPLGAKLV